LRNVWFRPWFFAAPLRGRGAGFARAASLSLSCRSGAPSARAWRERQREFVIQAR
jgi:hypothetical protein